MTREVRPADFALIAAIRTRIEAVLDPLLRGVHRVALLDFPNHQNVGDSMIWLGQYEFLRSKGIEIAYAAGPNSFSPQGVRRKTSAADPVLIQGGGNLGDLYPREQRFRERVVTELLDRRIIQLPQSISFGSDASMQRAYALLDAHPSFTLLVRDHQSLELARDKLGSRCVLCPDMAVCLRLVNRPSPSFDGVVWLERNDQERAASADVASGPRIRRIDWAKDEPPSLASQYLRLEAWDRRLRLHGRPMLVRRALYRRLAEVRLRRGIEIVSEGRSLVTERLHGHILALLLGLPHVVLDNSYGKTKAFLEAWTKHSVVSHLVDSRSEAAKLALKLASAGSISSAGTQRG